MRTYLNLTPQIHSSAYVDPAAVIIGDVHLKEGVSIWPTCVLRGDQGRISIGENSNIQDGTIIHATGGISTVNIGANVTVGHRVLLHGCTVEDWVLVGMGAIVLDNAIVGTGSIIGAGALITAGTVIPPNSMVLGSPGKVVRILREGEFERWIVHGRDEYLRLASVYKNQEEDIS